MAITDLTGTTWTLNNSLTSYPGGAYSKYYYVNITTAETLLNVVGDYSNTFDLITIGYNNGAERNTIYLQLGTNYPACIASGNDTKTLPDTWNDYYTGEFTITGGTDATDSSLISWLEANATQVQEDILYTTTTEELTSIANAIRNKAGSQVAIEYPDGFITEISNL